MNTLYVDKISFSLTFQQFEKRKTFFLDADEYLHTWFSTSPRPQFTRHTFLHGTASAGGLVHTGNIAIKSKCITDKENAISNHKLKFLLLQKQPHWKDDIDSNKQIKYNSI